MKTIDSETQKSEQELILVDIEDLRDAFGGEAQDGAAAIGGASPSTVMCPQW